MQIHTLVTMANRIGQFFESYSDRNEALAEISNHIHKFWDPRMRRELLRQMDAGVTVDLLPIVVDAIAAHRSVLAV
ncbi:MAG: formate dehydrogenase subunit delta [Rhodoferax sp.]